jgi:hypothetical protein
MTSTKRPYTGLKVKPVRGKQAGTEYLVRALVKYSDKKLRNLGTFQIRKMRGKSAISVHARGTAADLGWSSRAVADEWMNALVEFADELGLEAIIDYHPAPHGRGWRCDRAKWQKYDKKTVSGAPNGRWFHVEVSVEMGASEEKMRAAFHQLLDWKKQQSTTPTE